MRKLIFIGIAIMLFSCANTKWYHPGEHGKDNLKADIYECKVQAQRYATERLSDPSHPRRPRAWRFVYKQNLNQHYYECMDKKGWRLNQ